jgi:hypothetical protein
MERPESNVRIRVDRYTQVCLTAIAVLLTLTVIGLWSERVPAAGKAEARTVKAQDTIAGTGKAHSDKLSSRGVQVELQRESNRKLDKTNQLLQDLAALLKSGDVKVKVTNQKEGKDAVP